MIQQMLEEVNPYVRFFYTHRELLQRQNQEDPFTVRLWLTRYVPRNTNVPINDRGRRQMNDLAVNGEIAAVFDDIDGLPDDRFLAFSVARDERLPLVEIVPQRLNNLMKSMGFRDPNCDPMCFSLIFPFGEAGYDERYEHNQFPLTAHSRVTMREFYRHRLHVRVGNLNLMFRMGKLFQEYVVCSWIKIEKNNLNFLRQNQASLRIMDYLGVVNHVNNNENRPIGPVGRPFILPSTFEGSDRAIKQHYYDGMEMAAKFGNADFFITFTSNPFWPEIQEHLSNEKDYLSRPDICSRVHNLKFQQFWKDLNEKHTLGVINANIFTKEFQKRGLAHEHILLWMDERDKPITPEYIDDVICCEIPDPEVDPLGYELVKKFMMHGPCLPNSPCMQLYGNRCSKGFPKPFNNETKINENTYPTYRRRNDGRTILVNRRLLDNRYVVAYNMAMLKKFRCHINIEVCWSLDTMKYLFKYICKGNDRVDVQTNALNNHMPFANQGFTREEVDRINQIEQEHVERENN